MGKNKFIMDSAPYHFDNVKGKTVVYHCVSGEIKGEFEKPGDAFKLLSLLNEAWTDGYRTKEGMKS
jgi:hypothetical protein